MLSNQETKRVDRFRYLRSSITSDANVDNHIGWTRAGWLKWREVSGTPKVIGENTVQKDLEWLGIAEELAMETS